MPKPTIHLLVRNRERTIFSDTIFALTSLNDDGEFDILPEHSNFISIIKEYIKIHKTDGTTQDMKLSSEAVLKLDEGDIHIFVGLIPIKKAPITAIINHKS